MVTGSPRSNCLPIAGLRPGRARRVAFAQYYQADQAIRTTEDLHRVVHDIARVAQDRYAQGRGSQQEVYKAEVENTRLATELVRLEAKRRGAAARRANTRAGESSPFGRGLPRCASVWR